VALRAISAHFARIAGTDAKKAIYLRKCIFYNGRHRFGVGFFTLIAFWFFTYFDFLHF
jgi:hypothetical protein